MQKLADKIAAWLIPVVFVFLLVVYLVTHDLREAVFLADTVYVMSSRPGRIVKRREVKLPRPRELEVTYTQEFQDIVHELRALIGKH